MSSEENHRNISGPDFAKSGPVAPGKPPRVDPEGFLFYVAFGFVIAVAFYNSAFFGFLDGRAEDEGSRLFLMYMMIYMMGSFGGEVGLLAIAAVLGKGPVWLRMLLVLGVGVCWIGSPFLNAPWNEEHEVSGLLTVVSLAFLSFPILFLFGQLPLWLCRIFLRWRIEQLGIELPQVASPQLTIAGILALTTAVAIAVALINLVPVVVSGSMDVDRSSLWLRLLGALLTAFIVSLLTTVPLAALVLRPRNGWLGLGLVALWYLALVFLSVAFEFISTRRYNPSQALNFAVQNLGLVVAMTAPLFLLRRWNYRLRWGRE